MKLAKMYTIIWYIKSSEDCRKTLKQKVPNNYTSFHKQLSRKQF